MVDFRGVEPLDVCPSLTSAKEESDERKDHPEAEVVRESELAEYKIDRDEDRQELQPGDPAHHAAEAFRLRTEPGLELAAAVILPVVLPLTKGDLHKDTHVLNHV